MTNEELMRMYLALDPFSTKESQDGYEYIHIVGTSLVVERYEENGWTIMATWEGSDYIRRDVRDVVMRRRLVNWSYPHEKVLGRVQRVLAL